MWATSRWEAQRTLPAGESGGLSLRDLRDRAHAQKRRLQPMPPGVSTGNLELMLDVLIRCSRRSSASPVKAAM